MSERRQYPLELSCGRTIEIGFRRLGRDARGRPLRGGLLYRCDGCDGDRVQVVACGELYAGRVDCERRCPDCENVDDGAWPAAEFEVYEAHLRAGLDAVVQTVDALEAERMATFAEVFTRALREGLIEPDDFAP
jgi:hypothetical protein